MYLFRQWWERFALRIALGGAALGAAVFLHQTNSSLLVEMYRGLTLPFQASPASEKQLQDAFTEELQARLLEVEQQNEQLKQLLDYTKKIEGETIQSAIIGRGADHWWKHLMLSRGKTSNIKVGYIVTAPGGLVGRITKSTTNTSQVLLISDPSSRVGVTVSRSRNMGYLRGLSSNEGVMEFFDKVPTVQKGDVIVTSPFSQLFPAGIPVGKVKSINFNKSPAPEAIIEFSAPIEQLEWVVVRPYSSQTSTSTQE